MRPARIVPFLMLRVYPMPDKFAAKFPLRVSREQARNAMVHALRAFVGRGRMSVKVLANESGVEDWRINQAMIAEHDANHRPLTPEALLSITSVLGPDFTNMWLDLAGQGAFALSAEDPNPGEIAADVCQEAATIARAASDGQFDDAERALLRSVGTHLVQEGERLVGLRSVASS